MNRREAVKTACLLGGALTACSVSVLIQRCTPKRDAAGGLSGTAQEDIVAGIADVLIPETRVPGAEAVGIGEFVLMMINDCYPQDIQARFSAGLRRVEEACRTEFDSSFPSASIRERESIVAGFMKEADDSNDESHFFKLIRELTFLGYFTSEAGVRQALAYVPVPGRYEGCVVLKSDQRAWSH